MAWSRAVGAFGAPIIVAYHPSGLPLGLWIVLEEYGLPAALPLALLLVLVALPVPLAVVGWARRAAS
jgi:molybdate/tungstate transport system permease protein